MPHIDAVYRMARRLAGDATAADDLVQETYLRALRAFDRFRLHDYGAKPWLMKILHNVFYSRLERSRREPRVVENAAFDLLAPVSTADTNDPDGWRDDQGRIDWDRFDQELKGAVESLPAEFREALLLWGMEEMSYKEIAEMCDVPIGTVMSRLHRARRSLADKLANYAGRPQARNEEG